MHEFKKPFQNVNKNTRQFTGKKPSDYKRPGQNAGAYVETQFDVKSILKVG